MLLFQFISALPDKPYTFLAVQRKLFNELLEEIDQENALQLVQGRHGQGLCLTRAVTKGEVCPRLVQNPALPRHPLQCMQQQVCQFAQPTNLQVPTMGCAGHHESTSRVLLGHGLQWGRPELAKSPLETAAQCFDAQQ